MPDNPQEPVRGNRVGCVAIMVFTITVTIVAVLAALAPQVLQPELRWVVYLIFGLGFACVGFIIGWADQAEVATTRRTWVIALLAFSGWCGSSVDESSGSAKWVFLWQVPALLLGSSAFGYVIGRIARSLSGGKANP